MLHFGFCLFSIFYLTSIELSEELKALPLVENKEFFRTELAQQDAAKNLFNRLNLERTFERTRLEFFSLIYNYLISLTSNDNNILKEISNIINVDANQTLNSNVQNIVNDLLGNESQLIVNNNHVADEIDKKLIELENLKRLSGFGEKGFNKNPDFFKYVQNIFFHNLTNIKTKSSEEDLLDENKYWVPTKDLNSRRIFKGKLTKIKRYPFMATVQIFNRFHCAGSIIESDLVITAASCLQLAYNNRFFRENPAYLSVRVGSNYYSFGGENIPVLEVYFYPSYDPRSLKHNLCILRLVRHLKFRKRSMRVKMINIDRNPWPLPLTTDGITIVGWGARTVANLIGNPATNRISFANLDIYPVHDCQDIYSKEYVTKLNFCAGFISHGGGACNRDVGAPGVVHGVLTGVVSFGSPMCGASDAPTVFTKLGYYTDWIEDIMEMKVPVGNQRTTRLTKRPKYKETTFEEKTTPIIVFPIIFKKNQSPKLTALRSDQDMYKEFLSSIFSSKELANYENSLRAEQNTVNNKSDVQYKTKESKKISKESYEDSLMNKLPATDMEHYQSDEYFTESSYTVLPIRLTTLLDTVNNNDEKLLNKNLETRKDTDIELQTMRNPISDLDVDKLLATIDIDKIVQEAALENAEEIKRKTVKADENLKAMFNKSTDSRTATQITTKADLTPDFNDDFLTFIYNSDIDKKAKIIKSDDYNDKSSDGEGLSIPGDSLKDFTLRSAFNNSIDFIDDVLSRDEFYDILTEVVNAETQR